MYILKHKKEAAGLSPLRGQLDSLLTETASKLSANNSLFEIVKNEDFKFTSLMANYLYFVFFRASVIVSKLSWQLMHRRDLEMLV